MSLTMEFVPLPESLIVIGLIRFVGDEANASALFSCSETINGSITFTK